MNAADISGLFARQQQFTAQSLNDLLFIQRWVLFLSTAYLYSFIFSAIAAIHCAHKGPKESKAAWVLVILAVPFVGWISYWFLNSTRNYLPEADFRRDVPPAPPQQGSRDVAAAVTANIEEMLKNRKK